MGLGGDDGLGAGAGIAAPDAVHVAGGPGPLADQGLAALLSRRDGEADVAEEARLVEAEAVPGGGEVAADLGDVVVEAGKGDAALGVVQVRDDAAQQVGGVQGHAAVEAGMKVPRGGEKVDLGIGHAAEARGDGGGGRVPHVGVADDDGAGVPQFRRVGFEEGIEAGAADLLLALDQDADGGRRAAGDGVPSAEGGEPGEDLAFVVHGAAGDGDGAVAAFTDGRLEGGRGPEFVGLCGLNVVMAVVE